MLSGCRRWLAVRPEALSAVALLRVTAVPSRRPPGLRGLHDARGRRAARGAGRLVRSAAASPAVPAASQQEAPPRAIPRRRRPSSKIRSDLPAFAQVTGIKPGTTRTGRVCLQERTSFGSETPGRGKRQMAMPICHVTTGLN